MAVSLIRVLLLMFIIAIPSAITISEFKDYEMTLGLVEPCKIVINASIHSEMANMGIYRWVEACEEANGL